MKRTYIRFLTLLFGTMVLFIGGVRATSGGSEHPLGDLVRFAIRLVAVVGAVATWAKAVQIASVYKVVWPLFVAVLAVIVVIAAVGPW